MIPILNETYNYFDDGKIRESRMEKVVITEVIPFSDVDESTLELWKEKAKRCHWLYSDKTDYFIKANMIEYSQNLIFVRTHNGGWFSFGNYLWDGRLDVDGSLKASITNNLI